MHAKTRSVYSFSKLDIPPTIIQKEHTAPSQNTHSPCDVAALKKCLEENAGDRTKCAAHIASFQKSCSQQKSTDIYSHNKEENDPHIRG